MGGAGLRALLKGILCVSLLLAGGAPAQAQTQEPLTLPSPILTVELERLIEGSQIAERISAEVARLSADLNDENRKIEADLVAEELDLTKRRPELPPDEFRALADAFDERVHGIRNTQDAKARALQQKQEELRQSFVRQISPILAEIVRERGAVMVLDRRSVFLSPDTLDITDEAIERIDASLSAEDVDPVPATDGTTTPEEN